METPGTGEPSRGTYWPCPSTAYRPASFGVAALGSALRAIAATPELAGRYAVDGHGSYVPGDGSLVPVAPSC